MNITEQSVRAQRMDDLNTPEFTEFLKLTRQADRLRESLSSVRTQGRFIAASDQHDGPAGAVRAARAEVDALSERVQNAVSAQAQARTDRCELDALLNHVTSELIDDARTLRERKASLEGERGEIQRSRERREKAIFELMEAGLGSELAEQQAKPTAADIEALCRELADIPGDLERNAALMSSYSGRLELHLSDADSADNDDDAA